VQMALEKTAVMDQHTHRYSSCSMACSCSSTANSHHPTTADEGDWKKKALGTGNNPCALPPLL
jgi:hypothetical protein